MPQPSLHHSCVSILRAAAIRKKGGTSISNTSLTQYLPCRYPNWDTCSPCPKTASHHSRCTSSIRPQDQKSKGHSTTCTPGNTNHPWIHPKPSTKGHKFVSAPWPPPGRCRLPGCLLPSWPLRRPPT